MKKAIIFLILLSILISINSISIFASGMDDVYDDTNFDQTSLDYGDINAKSAVLMDAETGTLLYAKNPNEALHPASVTKIMTLLLVAEAINDKKIGLNDKINISTNAASMGGSQIFLKEGEEFSVEELLKSTIIASANDAAVALAEYVGGSEEQFVILMNERAKDLGLKNTNFENTTGLDDDVTNHKTSAYDIAIMSRELIKHDIILKYSTQWQDTVRDGEFTLTNTNRLVRYYQGCTGLKTGYTEKAGFCMSATAKKGDMHLISVIMGAETRDERNNSARSLLDWGFANYAIYKEAETKIENIPILKGVESSCELYSKEVKILVNKNDLKKIEKKYNIPDSLTAPIKSRETVGKITYTIDGKVIGQTDIYAEKEIEAITPLILFCRIMKTALKGI